MVVVPFLYFFLLFVCIFYKNGFDVAALMTSVYAFISFCAIPLALQNYDYIVDFSTINISFGATIVYCGLLTLTILPFISYNSNRPRKLVTCDITLFNIISYTFIIVFFILLLLYAVQIIFVIMSGDLGELRVEQNANKTSITAQFSGPLRTVAGITTLLAHGGYYMIVFFFYSICALNKSKLFNILLFLSSTSPIILGILNIDRSKTIYWLLLFALSYVMFKQFIVTPRQKNIIRRMGVFILVAAGAYLLAVTVSRFGERDYGTEGGLLIYAGQPFLNFCNMWDNLWIDVWNTKNIFPTFHYLFGSDGMHASRSVYVLTNLHLNVFFTFLGFFLREVGHGGMLIAVSLIILLFSITLKKMKKSSNFTISSAILFFMMATIVQCGCFSYFYSSVDCSLNLWLFIFLSYLLRDRRKNRRSSYL